jgi:hypothetical protein
MWALAILFAVTPMPLLATSMRGLRDFPAHPMTLEKAPTQMPSGGTAGASKAIE